MSEHPRAGHVDVLGQMEFHFLILEKNMEAVVELQCMLKEIIRWNFEFNVVQDAEDLS